MTSNGLAHQRLARSTTVVTCLIMTAALAAACGREPDTPAVLAPRMADTFSFMQINPNEFRWATVMPFSVQNTSRRPVEILEVDPSEVVNVEIAEFYVIGPRVPSLANAVLRGWPPVPGPANISPQSDKENLPSMPTLDEFHSVRGFVVDPKPKNDQARIPFGTHRLYSDLSNEATIVMRYQLARGKRVGFVKGFKVQYRIAGHRVQTLDAPQSAMGLCFPYQTGSVADKCSFEAAIKDRENTQPKAMHHRRFRAA